MVGQISTIVQVIIFVAGFLDISHSANNELVIPPNTGCACTSSVLTYTCTAVGTGNTLWTGTAFDCLAKGIILRHERFTQSGGAIGECGAIRGRSTRVQNTCYTSQVDITVSVAFNNKTVQCIHNSGDGINMVGTSLITVIEAPYPPPNNVRLVDVNQDMLTFSWDSLGPNCDSIMYGISSTCGSCGPTSTNATTVDCFDFQLSTDVPTCTFSVNLILCGDTGPSNVVTVTLKVPNIPRAAILPVYSANRTLTRIMLVLFQEDSFNIADGVSGAVLNYNTHLDSDLSVINSACGNDICEYAINLTSSICNASATVNTSVSATNRLGEGPPSEPIVTECTNQFVEIEYNSATSTISCVFQNRLDTSIKSCSIEYGICDQELTKMAVNNATSSSIMLNLALTGSGGAYCYIITARNRTYTVMVDGTIEPDAGGSPSSIEIIVPVIIITTILVIGVTILIILTIQCRHKLNDSEHGDKLLDMKAIEKKFTDNDLPCLKLRAVDQNEWDIVMYNVGHDCSLIEFIEKKCVVFKRGRAFYEFKNEVENISEDKQLILFETETGKYFSPGADAKELCEKRLIGERVSPPSLTKYKVFVQSTGLGARHLAKGSTLLYVKPKPHPLWNVDLKQFEVKKVERDCTLQTFCDEHKLDSSECAMYIEHDDFREERNIEDIIVMDKDTKKFLTGVNAHYMIKDHSADDLIIKKRWKVFLLRTYEAGFNLKKDKKVLYQVQEQPLIEHRQKPQQQNQDQQQRQCYSVKPALIRIDSSQFTKRKLNKNYKLSEFRSLLSVDLDPNEGNVFVEAGKVKMDGLTILDVILMDTERQEFYTGPSSQGYLRGGINTEPKKFTAFVLCDFEEKLILLKNTCVLYRVYNKQWQTDRLPLVPVYSKHFTIEYDCNFGEFCKRKNLGKEERKYVFVECTHLPDTNEHVDVILMDKHSSECKLFTYPCARLVIRKHLTDDDGNIQKEIDEKWRVFTLKKYSISEKDTVSVLYQDHDCCEKFHILKVDQNNIRMSEFIEKKIGSFENGKAFYEFKKVDEDLSCYKEVVYVPENKYRQRVSFAANKELQCECHYGIEFFYKIPGVPGFKISPRQLLGSKVFIQSTSQGSRCLKTDMVVLYKK